MTRSGASARLQAPVPATSGGTGGPCVSGDCDGELAAGSEPDEDGSSIRRGARTGWRLASQSGSCNPSALVKSEQEPRSRAPGHRTATSACARFRIVPFIQLFGGGVGESGQWISSVSHSILTPACIPGGETCCGRGKVIDQCVLGASDTTRVAPRYEPLDGDPRIQTSIPGMRICTSVEAIRFGIPRRGQSKPLRAAGLHVPSLGQNRMLAGTGTARRRRGRMQLDMRRSRPGIAEVRDEQRHCQVTDGGERYLQWRSSHRRSVIGRPRNVRMPW